MSTPEAAQSGGPKGTTAGDIDGLVRLLSEDAVLVSDGTDGSVSHSVTVGVTAANDAPVTDLNGAGAGNDATAAFTEQTPVLIAPAATITDADTANLTSMTVTLTTRPDGNAVEWTFGKRID